MTDPAPQTQPVLTAKAPDVTNDASYQNQAVALGAYAQNAFNGVLAQYRFMGLIAGIKGPNDTDQDVTNARNAIMEALSDFFSIKDGPLDTALAESYHKYLEMRERNIYDQFPTDEALWVQDLVTRVGRMGHPLDLASYTREYASGSRRPDLSQYLSSGAISAKGAAYINKAADHYQKAAQYAQQMREIRAEKNRQWWSDLWSSIKDYYNDKMELIGKGQWLLAAGKVSIDIAVFAAEEVIVGGIITAVIAITGGLAAAAVLALRAGVRAAISVVRLGTRTVRRVTATYRFRIELTKVSPNTLFSNPSPIAIKVERKLPYRKDIDVEKDLTAAERKAMGEGGQGSTRPDVDAPEHGPNEPHDRDVSDEDGTGTRHTPRRNIDCFEVPNGVNRTEFDRQLREQQDTINSMTADEMAYAHAVLDQARQSWRESGRKGSFTNLLRDPAAQNAVRKSYLKDLVEAGLSDNEIDNIMGRLNATHFLDIIAGGNPRHVGMGGATENQRIGPAWTHNNTASGVSRAEMLKREANAMRASGLSNHKMNIGLSSCP